MKACTWIAKTAFGGGMPWQVGLSASGSSAAGLVFTSPSPLRLPSAERPGHDTDHRPSRTPLCKTSQPNLFPGSQLTQTTVPANSGSRTDYRREQELWFCLPGCRPLAKLSSSGLHPQPCTFHPHQPASQPWAVSPPLLGPEQRPPHSPPASSPASPHPKSRPQIKL